MSVKIKKCPFCSSQFVTLIEDETKTSPFAVECECGAIGPNEDTKEEAIWRWNSASRWL